MKIFINTPLNESLRAHLRSLLPTSVTPVFKSEVSEEAAQQAFQTADIIMGNPSADWFRNASANLVYWQLDSAGFDQYKNVATNAQVANMGDFFARPCAETMVGGLLAFYRGIDVLAKKQEQKEWVGKELRYRLGLISNKKVVILGAGAIGQAVKQMLAGFNCQVQMTARKSPLAELHSFEEVLAALPTTDVVVNTLPGGAERYVSKDFINAMKEGSVYASVGRGSTTDEVALIAALQAGKLAGAVLDVTEIEPLPAESPLWEMENVILTQHSGGGQMAEDEGKIAQFLANLNLFLAGHPLQNQVDLAQGY
ncbi:D-2-hydroxyacid dehydrogenase [Adhaeribacter aquaticus]|uniref:D-2-hydroxyacid dehydrogenase n=1 Tax=Adhaeribacter aquaticus TaxID=299567 RepID=UPI000408702E|nr:D-2-hydroxyacid dehydrogenase [Adhaeribacter aquaticus]